ncbi:hypothetical protein MC885_007821 [Smutsia gigantea]|nr:hypothetical protein MC885_007821 [Smutsia gigantea]
MVEDLASYIALKLENEILQAHVQRLIEENAALRAQISELQKPQTSKQDEPLQKPSEAQERQKCPESLGSPEAWELQDPSEVEVSQKPRDPQDLPTWEPPSAQEPSMVHKLLAAWAFQKPPKVKELHKSPNTQDAQEPPDIQDSPMAQEPQNSEPQDPPNAQEPQEAPECQETSTHLEPLELLAHQELAEPQLTQGPLDPSDTQEFLEVPAPQESLEYLVAAETSSASEFPQYPRGLEDEVFLLDHPLAFNEDAQKLPELLVQLNSYTRLRRLPYPTEAALVSFLGNCFSSEARLWFQPLVVIQRHLLEQFESFIQVLQDPFNNPENMEDVNHCIRQLCQRDDPVHQCETHFILIAQTLNCIQFQEGLASSI